MIWFKRDPWIIGLLFIATLLMLGESYWVFRIRKEAIRAVAGLEEKNRERETFASRSPAPTEENERAIAHDLEIAQTKLSEVETAFGRAVGSADETSRIKPTAAYFEIAGFTEKARTLAVQSHVSIRGDEQFGFASHASEGPSAEILPVVLRQGKAAEALLDTLFAAQPAALISLQRERPMAKPAPSSQGTPADFFEPVVALSLRKPGVLETDAFKLEFTGQTRALRDFLNGLVSAGSVFAVRSVESEPFDAGANKSRATAQSGTPIPVIAEGLSHFRVVVERVWPATETKGTAP